MNLITDFCTVISREGNPPENITIDNFIHLIDCQKLLKLVTQVTACHTTLHF